MKKLLNNLYITTNGSYIYKDRETLSIEQEGKKVFQLPFHALQNIFCFGQVMVSPALMGACGAKGVGISFFTEYGKFQARLQGPQSGNVLLRRAQYRLADSSPQILARLFIASKLNNCRNMMMKHQRNHGKDEQLEKIVKYFHSRLRQLEQCNDVDQMRGVEGDSAASYFSGFSKLIVEDVRESFPFSKRTRRPPLDFVNALLSFTYTLLTHEIASALQGVGIDPYVGFLHVDRPGRLSLALDMLEEFRAWWCDRFVLTLINRKQITPKDFITEGSSAVRLTDEARKTVLTAWQAKKQEELQHPYTDEKIQIGLLPHIQSMLLSRYLRNDIEIYPPFVSR
jgi:CRISPR-associated protein Cas1